MIEPLRHELDHEELFVGRYDLLLRTALRVTEGDRQAAEDLVQDAFIRFTVVQPPLHEVAQLDAYFYAMLRNMHTSRIRRGQVAKVSLSILDFDSLDIGFDALDAPGRLQARQTVRAACEYGCVRRHTSKIGSIFLLRFFHGYLPSEIARIARLSTAMIDDQLFRARREVKLFVEQPGHLTFIDSDRAAAALRTSASGFDGDDDGSEEALVRQLRARMFSERHESCWPHRALRELYDARQSDSLTRETLAAIVGCPMCLDEVNAIVNVPKLASRWPTDTLGPGSRGPGRDSAAPEARKLSKGDQGSLKGIRASGAAASGGPGSGGTVGGRSLSRFASARRRAGAVFEHRPHELRVHVNGFELGSHTIGSRHSELSLATNIGEPVALVELFSEQGLCLLFLDASPPPGGTVRQRRRVELSEGRYAEVEVVFGGPWPTVRASYFDPSGGITVDRADEQVLVDRAIVAPRVPRIVRLFGLRPTPVYVLLTAFCLWLFFWTPGLEVSAAARIAEAIKQFAIEWVGRKPAAIPTPERLHAPLPVTPKADATSPAPASPRASLVAPRLTKEKGVALELRALFLLQRVDAYLGQEVSFDPSDGTRVVVRAVVDGDDRKHAVEKTLASLADTRDVRIVVDDLRQAAARIRSTPAPSGTPAQAFEFVKDQYPMFEPLRAYFRAQRSEQSEQEPIDQAEIDRDVRRFTLRVLDHSRRASQHAWALQYIAERFPSAVLRAASTETKDLWRSVVREHARGYLQEVALVRTELEPVVKADPPGLEFERRSVPPDLWASVARLLDLQKTQDSAIASALTMQRDGDGSGNGINLIATQAFWRLIDETTSLAARIAESSASL